ncbi:hypothetical protein ACROYT_G035550 [Oculina patagonica]
MARPRGAKPNGCRPCRAENENFAKLTSEVLRLRLQALNLPITGSKAQMVKRLKAALQPQQAQMENPGRVRKRKANTRVVRERRDKQPNPTNQPDERDPTRAGAVDEVDDDFCSVSSVKDIVDPLDIDDPLAEVTLEETQPAPFTASQLATIRETVQRSITEALQQSPPQPHHGLAVSPSLVTPRRPGAATPLGLQHPVDKNTEDKILRGEYLDFTVLLPDSLNQSQVPELQVRFDDSGPGSSNMTMVRKRKPVIDTFHKWLDAYTTYMIVLVTAYPRRSLELLKYQQTISCAATKFKGLSWLTYDEQFRKRAAQDLTINWGQPAPQPERLPECRPFPPADRVDQCAFGSTAPLGVPPAPASSPMSAVAAIPTATLSSTVQEASAERTTAASDTRAPAMAEAAKDKVHLLAKQKTPNVSTPINVNVLERELSRHPDHNFVTSLINGLRYGTHVGYTGPEKSRVSRNLISANQHPEVVSSNLSKEINLGRVAGPFNSPPLPNLQCHPVGVVPKKHSSEWRTIYHLSYPEGDSINDHIPKDPYSLQYVRVDDAIRILKSLGPGSFMAKTDLKSAFRLIPVHPDH